MEDVRRSNTRIAPSEKPIQIWEARADSIDVCNDKVFMRYTHIYIYIYKTIAVAAFDVIVRMLDKHVSRVASQTFTNPKSPATTNEPMRGIHVHNNPDDGATGDNPPPMDGSEDTEPELLSGVVIRLAGVGVRMCCLLSNSGAAHHPVHISCSPARSTCFQMRTCPSSEAVSNKGVDSSSLMMVIDVMRREKTTELELRKRFRRVPSIQFHTLERW